MPDDIGGMDAFRNALLPLRGHGTAPSISEQTPPVLPRCLGWSLTNKRHHYVDKTVNYEALMVARNAPRWHATLIKYGYVTIPAQ